LQLYYIAASSGMQGEVFSAPFFLFFDRNPNAFFVQYYKISIFPAISFYKAKQPGTVQTAPRLFHCPHVLKNYSIATFITPSRRFCEQNHKLRRFP
jgi:hypothetical protein